MGKRSLKESGGGSAAKRRASSSQHVENGREDPSRGLTEAIPNTGIIRKVELKNFMNHASLTFDFEPRVRKI